MTCKCGGTLIRFYYCPDIRATVAMCEKCGQWHRMRHVSDDPILGNDILGRVEADPLPESKPKPEPEQETWRDRPPMF